MEYEPDLMTPITETPAGRTKDIPSHSYSKIVYGACSG